MPPLLGFAIKNQVAVMSDQENQSQKKSRWAVFAILAVPLAIFFSAYLWLSFFSTTGTTNIGHLIQPAKPFNGLGDDLHTKSWNIVVLVSGGCDNGCKERLAVVRNAHWALGKEASRVERSVLFLDASGQSGEGLDANFPKLRRISMMPEKFNQWRLDGVDVIAEPFHLGVIIFDPLGNAFIYYDPLQTGNNIILDMRKLLKFSSL